MNDDNRGFFGNFEFRQVGRALWRADLLRDTPSEIASISVNNDNESDIDINVDNNQISDDDSNSIPEFVSPDLNFFDESKTYEDFLREYPPFQFNQNTVANNVDQCILDWPQDAISNHKIPNNRNYFGFDIYSKKSKRKFLKYWAYKIGVGAWLYSEDNQNEND